MKSILLILITLCFTLSAYGSRSPFSPWINQGELQVQDGKIAASDANAIVDSGQKFGRIARFTYDVAVDGGSIATFDLGENLPANAVIIRSTFFIVTAFVAGAGTPTITFTCEDAGNIKASSAWAADITATAGTATSGASDGTVANYKVGIAAACDISAVVASNTMTAGKVIGFVEYVVAE